MRASLAPARPNALFDRPSTFLYLHNPGATPIFGLFAHMTRLEQTLRTLPAQKGEVVFCALWMLVLCQQMFWVTNGPESWKMRPTEPDFFLVSRVLMAGIIAHVELIREWEKMHFGG